MQILTNLFLKMKKAMTTKNKKKAKLASIKSSLNEIYKLCGQHLELNDERLFELSELEFILGVTQILFENKIISEGKSIPMAFIVQTEDGDKQVDTTKKRTFH